MTLPPRLPAIEFAPEPERIPVIRRRALRRRRSRAAGALGVVSVTLAGIAVVGGTGGAAGLRVVEPAVPAPSGSATPEPSGTPMPSPSPAPEVSATPPATPPATPRAGGHSPGRTAEPWAAYDTARVHREVVPYDTDVPCSERKVLVYNNRAHDSTTTCLRYSWPASVPYGKGATFLVDFCAENRDLRDTFAEWPRLTVRHIETWDLFSPTLPEKRQDTLAAGTCWRWTIEWNGMRDDEPEPLPAGTYEVLVYEPSGGWTYATSVQDDGRQTTLDIG